MEYVYRLVERAWRSRVLRAAASGAAGVAVQTTLFELLGIWLKVVAPSSAVVVGAEFGILTNFFIANCIAFGDAPHAHWLPRLVKFHLVIVGSLIIQWACVHWTELFTSDPWLLNAAFLAGVVIGFAFNYTGYRLWVWRHHTTLNEK